MTPTELETFLTKLVNGNVTISTMIWGAPGIGKSSIVAAVAEATSLQLIDVRLSQLAPTDLRGLPVARHGAEGQLGTSVWYPPEFLPRGGKGILLLDELTTFLDAEDAAGVLAAVRAAVAARGVAALWVTHRLEELRGAVVPHF
jgi:ABC-type transport system involved in cytochrome bd biosynthesis fused ATPase/permease subunit